MKRLVISFILFPALVLLALTVTPGYSTVMTGEQFIITATDTSMDYTETNNTTGAISYPTDPNYGSTYTLELTLGAASTTNPGFFNISSLTVISGNLNLGTENLSALLFDPTTLDLSGDVTGSFIGMGGGTHTYVLNFTDTPATWTYTNDHVTDGFTDISSGTYSTALVPLPPSLLLMGSGLLGMAVFGWRRRENLG